MFIAVSHFVGFLFELSRRTFITKIALVRMIKKRRLRREKDISSESNGEMLFTITSTLFFSHVQEQSGKQIEQLTENVG